jgi:DNA-binding NarL/FixJ family response regulator
VHLGGRFLGAELVDVVGDEAMGKAISTDPLKQMSLRKRRVPQLLAEGQWVNAIAVDLVLSPETDATCRTRDGKAGHP